MIWVIGAVAVDLIARKRYFTPGTSTPAEIHIGVGGVGYRIFRNLGGPKHFVTAVGDDLLGQWLQEQLTREAGQYTLQTVFGVRTGCYSAFMEQGKLLYAASDMGCVEHLSWDTVASALDPVSGDLLVLEANLAPALARTLMTRYGDRCRIVFESVSVDKLGRHWPGLQDLYLLAANREEMTAVLPGADEIRSQMAAKRIGNIVMSRGSEGVVLFAGGAAPVSFNPTRVVAAEDTTGAGDRLLAELCRDLIDGTELKQAVPRAIEAVRRAMEENAL
jgi:sugar/nucleoside kinase (ribokinase family)